MRHLTATISLTVAVFLGSSGVSWSADFQKGLTAYKSGNYATALREWKPLAEQGNAVAQNSLDVMYEKGQGVSQDSKTAVECYRLAAEQGNAKSQNKLKTLKMELVRKSINDCLYDEIDDIRDSNTRRVVTVKCRKIFNKRSLNWLIRNTY
jgi:hypothetical protein